MTERYMGLCLNGPIRGQRIVSQTPFHRVAQFSPIHLAPVAITKPSVNVVEYQHVVNKDGYGDWWVLR